MLKVKKLETSNKGISSIRIVLSDDSSYPVHMDTVVHFSLYEDKDIQESELEDILNYNFSKILEEKAVSYIVYSPRTEQQVRIYLHKYCKQYELEDFSIEGIVQNLKDFKYINDKEYIELFLKSRLRNKPRSKFLLVSELVKKGIDKQTAIEMVEIFVPDDLEVLKSLYIKKFGDEPLKIDDKKKIGFLQRKGFSWDKINELIQSFQNNDT